MDMLPATAPTLDSVAGQDWQTERDAVCRVIARDFARVRDMIGLVCFFRDRVEIDSLAGTLSGAAAAYTAKEMGTLAQRCLDILDRYVATLEAAPMVRAVYKDCDYADLVATRDELRAMILAGSFDLATEELDRLRTEVTDQWAATRDITEDETVEEVVGAL